MSKPSVCERCKEPLVNDKAGFSSDGRLICTRFGCQFVEEINRRVAEGTLVLKDSEEFAAKVEFPTKQPSPAKIDPKSGIAWIEAIYLRPLPDTKEDGK
jgi:hypothetical protein